MEIYQTEEYRGCTISICYDQYADNPREINDGYLSHIICWHRNYNLGDKHEYGDEHEFVEHLARKYANYEQIEKYLLEHKGDCWLEKTADGYTLHDCDRRYYDAEYDKDAEISEIVDQCWEYLSDQDLFNLAVASDEFVIHPVSYYDHSGITVWMGNPNDPWDSGRCGWVYQTKKDTIEQNGGTEDNWREVAEKNMKAEMREYDKFLRGECFYWDVEDEDGDHFDGVGGYIGTDSVDYMLSEAKASIDNHIQQAEEKRNDLLAYMKANFDKLQEGQIFVCGDMAWRTDRRNLFQLPQLSSAHIKDNVVGVFDTADFDSVPTVMLECMKSTINKPQTVAI